MYKVDESKCEGCEACVKECPTEAIVMEKEKAKITDQCVDCGTCESACPSGAISSG
jgi:ferredoxin